MFLLIGRSGRKRNKNKPNDSIRKPTCAFVADRSGDVTATLILRRCDDGLLLERYVHSLRLFSCTSSHKLNVVLFLMMFKN